MVTSQPCPSPITFPFEIADGEYYFSVWQYDEAGNEGYTTNYVEVDTVAPGITSVSPTGKRVSPYADVKVTFDDEVYGSAKYVNINPKGSTKPLAVYRYYGDGDKDIEIDPKNALKRGTSYTVKVTTDVNDGANNLETAKSWSFKTKG